MSLLFGPGGALSVSLTNAGVDALALGGMALAVIVITALSAIFSRQVVGPKLHESGYQRKAGRQTQQLARYRQDQDKARKYLDPDKAAGRGAAANYITVVPHHGHIDGEVRYYTRQYDFSAIKKDHNKALAVYGQPAKKARPPFKKVKDPVKDYYEKRKSQVFKGRHLYGHSRYQTHVITPFLLQQAMHPDALLVRPDLEPVPDDTGIDEAEDALDHDPDDDDGQAAYA